jgi:spore maturation protein CgeB
MYFPEASDPEIFRPMPALPKTHDITFVGARYGIRERIVSALRRAGIRVTAFGNGWEHGRIGTEEVPRLFAQSRIVLGVSAIGHCDDFVALKLRDFDGPMSGTCYLTQANPDLATHYEIGKEIVTYRDVDECVVNARHLLSHEDERESIARAGRLRAVREHTWDKRFAPVLNVLHAAAARKSQVG